MKQSVMNHEMLRHGTAIFCNRCFLTVGLILASAAGAGLRS